MDRLPKLTEEQKTEREIAKRKKIKREIARLKKVFKSLDKNKHDTVLSLINRAAAMSVYLEELEEILNREGYTQEYKNGANQWGIKQSAEVEMYIAMTRNLSTVIKQLADLAPAEARKDSKIAALRNRRAMRDAGQ